MIPELSQEDGVGMGQRQEDPWKLVGQHSQRKTAEILLTQMGGKD